MKKTGEIMGVSVGFLGRCQAMRSVNRIVFHMVVVLSVP